MSNVHDKEVHFVMYPIIKSRKNNSPISNHRKTAFLPGGASVGGAGASSIFSMLLSTTLVLLSTSASLGELSLSSTFSPSSLVASFSPSSAFSSLAAASLAAFFLRKLKLFLKESFFLMLVARDSFFFSSFF